MFQIFIFFSLSIQTNLIYLQQKIENKWNKREEKNQFNRGKKKSIFDVSNNKNEEKISDYYNIITIIIMIGLHANKKFQYNNKYKPISSSKYSIVERKSETLKSKQDRDFKLINKIKCMFALLLNNKANKWIFFFLLFLLHLPKTT